jgi:hypothetical protein
VMRKIVSRRMGMPAMACAPMVSTRISPLRLKSATTPGTVPRDVAGERSTPSVEPGFGKPRAHRSLIATDGSRVQGPESAREDAALSVGRQVAYRRHGSDVDVRFRSSDSRKLARRFRPALRFCSVPGPFIRAARSAPRTGQSVYEVLSPLRPD